MSEENSVDKNLARAFSRSEKFETFLLGLAFAATALAIQTAKFEGSSTTAQIAEFAGWLLLAISCICGLWRSMYAGALYLQFAEIDRKRLLQIMIQRGQRVATVEILQKLNAGIERLTTASAARQRWIQGAFDAHLWTLLLGMLLLMISRGLDPATKLIARIACC
jgi:hypothetical protein